MSKLLKNVIGKDLGKRFQGLESYIIVDYRGLDSAQSYDLRKILRESGTRMTVVPNRLVLRILDRWNGEKKEFRAFFRGPTAILYGQDGAIAASRAVMAWKKKNKDLLPIKGGVLQGQVIDPRTVEGLAKIPDRPVLLAQVAGGFRAPMAKLASALQQIVAKVAYALEARRKKLEEAGGAAAGGEAPPAA